MAIRYAYTNVINEHTINNKLLTNDKTKITKSIYFYIFLIILKKIS